MAIFQREIKTERLTETAPFLLYLKEAPRDILWEIESSLSAEYPNLTTDKKSLCPICPLFDLGK